MLNIIFSLLSITLFKRFKKRLDSCLGYPHIDISLVFKRACISCSDSMIALHIQKKKTLHRAIKI